MKSEILSGMIITFICTALATITALPVDLSVSTSTEAHHDHHHDHDHGNHSMPMVTNATKGNDTIVGVLYYSGKNNETVAVGLNERQARHFFGGFGWGGYGRGFGFIGFGGGGGGFGYGGFGPFGGFGYGLGRK